MKMILIFLACSILCAGESHPVTKVNTWFNEEKELTEGRFFKFASLATVSSDGYPHVRMIEITHLHPREGALFFTHQNTEKVTHIAFKPYGALNIWLPRTHRQVSMEGTIQKVGREETEKSWSRMPRFMQLTFIASNHTGNLESSKCLEDRKALLEKEYPDKIPCPSTFIGYRLTPDRVIFYEINHRSFPKKEIALINQKDWTLSLVEP